MVPLIGAKPQVLMAFRLQTKQPEWLQLGVELDFRLVYLPVSIPFDLQTVICAIACPVCLEPVQTLPRITVSVSLAGIAIRTSGRLRKPYMSAASCRNLLLVVGYLLLVRKLDEV